MLRIQTFTFNALQENTYIVYDEETRVCAIIDPGCFDPEEKYELASFIEDQQLQVQMLLNTHCHVDHVLGNYFVKEKYRTKLFIHEKEVPVLKAVTIYAPHYGIFGYDEASADEFLLAGEAVHIGKHAFQVLFVPGHSPGHVAFYCAEAKILIGGDVLFYNSIGRTDLPGGDHSTLIASIDRELFVLPDDVVVYPGHGPETTIGFEKRTNPFCAISIRR